MAAKIFEVGDVLPATTQLKVAWEINSEYANRSGNITTTNSYLWIYFDIEEGNFEDGYIKVNNQLVTYLSLYPGPYEIIIDTSSWNVAQRTITLDEAYGDILFYWEDLNAPSGYTITFEENGGSTVTDLTEQTALPNPLPIPTKENHSFLGWYYDSDFTNEAFADDPLTGDVTLYAKWEEISLGYTITFDSNGGSIVPQTSNATQLPSPLPTPTKSGYTFVNWYYDSAFTQKANAGDTIESNVTLYAKWHNLGSLFTEIADAIRSKDGTSENIRDVDFGERIKQIQGAKEEETKTLEPDFSGGNQVITPTSGKVLSQVTLTKPTDLLPENIAKDKNVCGVVGTLESGGGNSLVETGTVFTFCYTSDPMYLFPLTKVEIYRGTTLVHTSNEYPSGLEDGTFTWLFNGSWTNTNAFKIRLYGGAGGYVNYAKIVGFSVSDTIASVSPNLVDLTKTVGPGYTEWTCSISRSVQVIVCLMGNND